MNLRDTFKHTVASFIAGNAVAWISDPGMGKSDSVGKLASWMPKAYPNERVGIAGLFMATASPIALGGLPWKGTLSYGGKEYTITDPAIPQWAIARDLRTGEIAPVDTFGKVLLVLEEWGQGDLETKRAGADLLLNGACGNFRLPPGSPRLALSNISSKDGVTKEFDFVINRRNQIEIKGDVDVWIEDFADKPYQLAGRTWNVMPVTKAWARQNPQILYEDKPKQQGPWCTQRSITMWDRYAQALAEQNGGEIPLEDAGFVETTQGYIGAAASMSVVNHLRFRLELPSLEDVVSDPAGTEIPKKPDLMMLMAYELAGRCKPDQLAPVLQYVTRMGTKAGDMPITFVTAMLRRDYKTMIDLPPMKAWIAKNARMVSIIASLAQ